MDKLRRRKRSSYSAIPGLTFGQAITIWVGTLAACGVAILASFIVTGRLA